MPSPLHEKERLGPDIDLAVGAGRVRGSLIGSGMRSAATRLLTVTLANVLGPFGISVVCISPGSTMGENGIARYEAQAQRED